MKRAFQLSLFLFFLIVLFPSVSCASCPDQVICYMSIPCPTSNCGSDAKWKGTISVPTCWKALKGCKPWHCDGQYKDTDSRDWLNKCKQRFDMTGKRGQKRCVTFPVVHKSDGQTGGQDDYCEDVQ